jgi:hypothetical protein
MRTRLNVTFIRTAHGLFLEDDTVHGFGIPIRHVHR